MKKMNALMFLLVLMMPLVSMGADRYVGNNYQITTVIGNITETHTIYIDATVAGGYYSGVTTDAPKGIRFLGPKNGSQICMSSEALVDKAFTFCFNMDRKVDRSAFTTVTDWGYDSVLDEVFLYSDVYRATVTQYKLVPRSVAASAVPSEDPVLKSHREQRDTARAGQ